MASRVLIVLALCAVGAYSFPEPGDIKVLQERQKYIIQLFQNIHLPLLDKESLEIASKWDFEKSFDLFNNVTAVKTYAGMLDNKWHLPRDVPYSPYEPAHNFETLTLFNVFYSAKTFETFYNVAVYLREYVNEDLYVYTLSVAIFYRPDTQGLTIPPLYEVLPSYFNYGEIINTADKALAFGGSFAHNVRPIAMYDDIPVIKANEVYWPYNDQISQIKYFTNDYGLNAAYYFSQMLYPYWLSSKTVPGIAKDRRGELWWFTHKQIVARYYMERLSAGLGEIPEITDFVPEGFVPGLVYENGIPYPSRPDDFYIKEKFASELEAIKQFESRLWDAIDRGFFYDKDDKKVNLLTEQGIDYLGNLVESNADSLNSYYFKDYIKLWKAVLGNSDSYRHEYYKHFTPLVVPSALENYQTSLRDPAFYMMWKRVLKMFQYWQKRMPLYKPEDLTSEGVEIEKVETDKLVTFFDTTVMMYYPKLETKGKKRDDVLIQHPRLNHKPFNITVTAKSEKAKKVFVKFFLAPKYDSKGNEIPLHRNTENFFQLDQFFYDLKEGENTIVRQSTVSLFTSDDLYVTPELYDYVVTGVWKFNHKQFVTKFPTRLLLPKGHSDGLEFLLITYIQDYVPPKTEFGSGYNRTITYGLGSGSRFPDDYPLGYPANRPLYSFQVAGLTNLKFDDVKIYHLEK